MLSFIATIIATIAAFVGGYIVFRNRHHLHNILSLTAGILIGAVAFDILPEIFENVADTGGEPTAAMIGLVTGFLLFHIIERGIALHKTHGHPETPVETAQHHHAVPTALALCLHSLLDGVAIGLAFQANESVGMAVAIAVIAHRFSDGINVVSLLLLRSKDTIKQARLFLVLVAIAPIIGGLLTMFITLSPAALVVYLGFIAGFLLHIVASDVLPEAHGHNSTYASIGLTVVGVIFIYVVSHFAHVH